MVFAFVGAFVGDPIPAEHLVSVFQVQSLS